MPLPTLFKLNSGYTIPAFGLGTWESDRATGADLCEQAVEAALECGIRHIDTAAKYECERQVSQAIRKSTIVKREDVFVVTKIWNQWHDAQGVERGCDACLKELQMEYIDLLLIHWPVSFEANADRSIKLHEDGRPVVRPLNLKETWTAMEKLVDSGKVRSIGVSNFKIEHLEEILSFARIQPAVNQIEIHPWNPQTRMLDFAKKHNILLTAYCPLGSGGERHKGVLIEDPTVLEIAKKNAKSPADVLLSWGCKFSMLARLS